MGWQILKCSCAFKESPVRKLSFPYPSIHTRHQKGCAVPPVVSAAFDHACLPVMSSDHDHITSLQNEDGLVKQA